MSIISISRSVGVSSITSTIVESSGAGVNTTDIINIGEYNEHSFQIFSRDYSSYQRWATPPTPEATPVPLSATVYIQVSNVIPSNDNQWVTVWSAALSASHEEAVHYKDIFNFEYFSIYNYNYLLLF